MSNKPQTKTARVPVRSSSHVAFVIGHGGSNVKRIQKTTGTNIKNPAQNEDPVFVITGEKAKVAEAANEIRSLAKKFDQQQAGKQNAGKTVTKIVRVPREHLGKIIGKGGNKIKKIQDDTDTKIKTPSDGSDPVFIVTGEESDVIAAEREIRLISSRLANVDTANNVVHTAKTASPGPSIAHSVVASLASKPSVAGFLGQFFGAMLTSVTQHMNASDDSDAESVVSTVSSSSKPASRPRPEKPKEPRKPRGPKVVTIQVTVPKRAVSFVIGSQASTIKAIAERTDTNVKTPNRNGPPIFVLTGKKENVEKARSQIEEIAGKIDRKKKTSSKSKDNENDSSSSSSSEEEGQSSRRDRQNRKADQETRITTIDVAVPMKFVGLVIGPKGATIAEIEKLTNTKIQAPVKDGPPVFTIYGNRKSVMEARLKIESLVAAAPPRNKNTSDATSRHTGVDVNTQNQGEELTVPTEVVGLVIGAKGVTVAGIEKATKTKIQSPAKGQPPVFKINGPKAGIKEARRRIEGIIAAVTPRVSAVAGKTDSSGDEASDKPDKDVKGSMTQQNKPFAQTTIEVPIPGSAIDFIVGADIENSTNTKIQVLSTGEPPVLKVTGSKNALKKARLLIDGIIAATAPLVLGNQTMSRDTLSPVVAEKVDAFVTDNKPDHPEQPDIVKKTESTVFVRNVASNATEKQLRDFFSSCGKVKKVIILRNKSKGNIPTGNVLVGFADELAVEKALNCDGEELLGRKIKVTRSRQKSSSSNANDEEKQLGDNQTATVRIKRPVVIDADNVCMAHGRNEFYSARGLELAVQYFEALDHKVLAVVPEEKIRCAPDSQVHRVEGQDILIRLEKAGNIVVVPRKKLANGSTVKPYADLLTVKYAFEEDGVIISNDNMIDVVEKNPQYKDAVESRRIMFTFALDKFMIIDDPNGRSGVHAVDLLTYEKESVQPDLITF